MKKTNHKFQRAMASFLAFVMVMLSTSLLTTISVLAADGDITYLAPVYDTDGNVTFDNDGNVVMAEQTLTDGTYNVVTTSTTVMGATDTAAEADANGEYWYVVNENVTMPTAITGITVTGKIHPHPRSGEGIRALAKFRGGTIGVSYAEAFMCIRYRD